MQTIKENEESYDILNKKIDEIGSIKDILSDMDKINKIISYNGDRNIFRIFIERINEELLNGNIYSNHLINFINGNVIDSLINLEETVKKYSDRSVFLSERLDKINYLTNLNDVNALATCFTHKSIIDALRNKADYDYLPMELTFFTKAYNFPRNLPQEVHALIIDSLIELNDLNSAKKYIELCKNKLKPNKTLALNNK